MNRGARKCERALRIMRTALVALTACAVALFFFCVPFRALLPAAALSAREPGEMRVHFLSVGQGDCTIVEFPDGDALVIDAGDGSFSANNELVRYLKGLDVTALTLIATHADADHFGGFAEVMRLFDVQRVFLPALGSDTQAYRRFLAAVQAEGCAADTLVRYDSIVRDSGAYAVCISPHAAGETDENDSSVTLYLSYGGVNMLLCADIGASRENSLLAEAELSEDIFDSGGLRVRLDETQILKAAHHGSAEASGEAWLSYLSPEAAVISCGAGNSYRHPAGETLGRLAQAGAEIYRTDELGHIVVSVKDGAYTIGSGGEG